MFKTPTLLLALLILSSAFAGGTDLYKVTVNSPFDADRLNQAGAEPIAPVTGGYLVLLPTGVAEELIADEIDLKPVTTGVSKDRLALDLLKDRSNADRYNLIFEEGGVRVYLMESDNWAEKTPSASVMPVRNEYMEIEYFPPREIDLSSAGQRIDLQALIDLVSRDSLESYATQLETFGVRFAGTPANNAAGDWAASKFGAFGYDSIVYDSFVEVINGVPTDCRNIVVVKPGTVLPDHHVIVGAHYDAVQGSPGADDNGSGVDGVLEIARILKDIDTDLTFVFILFDAEEEGLLGAYHYANEAFVRGDSIVYMLNMDMIAHYQNSNQANLFHGTEVTYTNLWMDLADSLVGIIGTDAGAASNSDHAAFTAYGWEATFVHEYIFSTVYHSPQDSTTYMNFDYMTDMVKASAATVYTVSQTYIPGPSLTFDYPDDAPSYITSDAAETFEVIIDGFYGGVLVPGTAELHYSLDGGEYVTSTLTEITSTRYQATLPAAPCGSHYRYYISGEEDSMGVFFNPDTNAPFEAIVADAETVVFQDDFETDQGWSVSGNATDGHWDRGVPVGGGDRGDPPYDYDGSGSCYLTDNFDDNTDVDGGYTYLDSPVFDLTNREGKISYARWYSNSYGADPFNDVMRVYISNDGGTSWNVVETVGPDQQASGGWFFHSFLVSDFTVPTDQMRVRFEVSDLGNGSVVEAGVDAFRVMSYVCGGGAPPEITTTSLPDGMMGAFYSVQLEAHGGFGPLTWSDQMNNLSGTGLSLSPDGLLSGYPEYMMPIMFTATVEDAIGGADDQYLSFQVNSPYVCGDANGDGEVNVGDGVFLINYIFKEGPAPDPIEAGDANCDGEPNVGDAVYIINYVFNEGPEPCCP